MESYDNMGALRLSNIMVLDSLYKYNIAQSDGPQIAVGSP